MIHLFIVLRISNPHQSILQFKLTSNIPIVRFTAHQRMNNSAEYIIKNFDGLYSSEPLSWVSLPHAAGRQIGGRELQGRKARKRCAGDF